MRAASIAFVAGFASFSEIRQRGYVAWIHEDLREVPLEEFWAKLEPMTKAKGRGGIGRLTIAGRELVVRPYRRGGAFGQLLNDRYSQPHRAKQELEVLHKLQQEGVPVVAPVAASTAMIGPMLPKPVRVPPVHPKSVHFENSKS